MIPIKTVPVFQDYLWGGNRLKERYGKQTALSVIAESWELSCNDHGLSGVAGSDEPLKDYLLRGGKAVLGSKYDFDRDFPILIKLIDAKRDLSVQVHPSDEYALQNEGCYGKTEMWVVVDCDPGSTLYHGLSRDCTKEELEKAIRNGTMTQYLNRVLVRPGDVFFIPPGTIHAIGAGVLLAEIQQNSDITYRLFDYDRKGSDGKPRRLDIEKGLAVANLKGQRFVRSRPAAVGSQEKLASCPYFRTDRVRCDGVMPFQTSPSRFETILVTDGRLLLHGPDWQMALSPGDCALLPARLGLYAAEGNCEYLRVTPGDQTSRK